MEVTEDCELLFFDTFSHENNEELNLDLVQFPRPVYINEIRIIPLGARVQADFPGGHRLGATNPSSFQLEFFVNDLSKRGACTFERLGSLEYKQNVDIQLVHQGKIPTDGLVLRGWYSTITVAVYGNLTRLGKERASPPPPPPPQPAPRSQILENRSASESEPPPQLEPPTMTPQEWNHPIKQEPILQEPPPPPPPPPIHAPPHHAPPPLRENPPPYPEVRSITHPIPTHHTTYAEHPPPPGHFPDSTTVPYSEHLPLSVAGGAPPPVTHPPPPAGTIPQYDVSNYPKQWPEEAYAPKETEIYERTLYGEHHVWDNRHKERRDLDERLHESIELGTDKSYEGRMRGRDRRSRERERDRDSHSREYAEDDNYSHGSSRDLKRRDRDYRHTGREKPFHEIFDKPSREREQDHNRERPLDVEYEHREPSTRDHEREERDRSRDRSRPREKDRDHGRDGDRRRRSKSRDSSHDSRGSRERVLPPKRPSTPASPTKPAESPLSPIPPEMALPEHKPKDEPLLEEVEPGEVHEEPQEPNPWGDMFEPLTPDQSPEPMYSLSDGEIQEGENAEDDDGYEEIISEEEDMSDGEEGTMDMADMDYELGDDAWNYMSSFNPFQCELTHLQHFCDSSFTPFEALCSKSVPKFDAELPDEANKLIELIQQFTDKEHNEKWVEAMETLASSLIPALAACNGTSHFEMVVNTLIEWACEGVNFEVAIKQPVTVYKVRHMKAGIRLATALFQTNEGIVGKLLDCNVLETLMEMYERPYMTLPIKMLILRAIDAAVCYPPAMERFTFRQHRWKNLKSIDDIGDAHKGESKEEKECTCYQKLLKFLISKQSTRVVVALTSLLRKIHTYEVLMELQKTIQEVTRKALQTELPGSDSEHSSDTERQHVRDQQEQISVLSEVDTETIVSCISELNIVYKKAKKIIAQPLRYLPAQVQFDVPETPFDPYPGLYKMFKEKALLESLFFLVSSPALSHHSGVMVTVKELLSEFLRKQHGMLFLMSLPEVANGIHRALLQNVDDNREDSVEENMTHQLGMRLVYHLQALLWVDSLLSYHQKGSKREVDDSEAVSTLHHLYTMIFSGVGRNAVADVLSMDRNLEALLPFLELTGNEEFDTKLVKSVCCGYATELTLMTIHISENISILENFSETLLKISQQELTTRLHELSSWLAPTKKLPSYSYEGVNHLMYVIKSWAETASTLPPELVTVLRILQHVALPPNNAHKNKDEEDSLKYKYATIQIISNDGLASFLTILQKVCDLFLKPSHQSPALTGHQGTMVLAILKPTIMLLQFMLSYLISCRGSDFHDLTAVPILLRVYSLMAIFPLSSFSYPISQQIQVEICETLLAYTQPCLGNSESEEALSKSLWTKMVQEVLKYTLTTPSTFVPGLAILSELLPLPLPLQTPQPLNQEEVTKAVNSRKLWSAHIHSLSNEIQEVIVSLSATSCQPMQQLLRRICQQLSDLAAPTAIIVVRAVLDAILAHLPPAPAVKDKEEPTSSQPTEEEPCSSTAARVLNFLSYLISNAPFKITMLHLLQGSVKRDEKYGEVLPRLLQLLNVPSDKASHIQAQECIVSILQSLCDPDIGLMMLENGVAVHEVLANSLPPKDQLLQICMALIQHIGGKQHNYASILLSLRTLVMLTEHDLGFWHVKCGLERDTTSLHSLLSRLSTTFSKDSSDYLSTLSTAVELLRSLVHGFEDVPPAVSARVLRLSGQELASLMQWKVPSKQQDAPVPETSEDADSKQAPEQPKSVEAAIAEVHPLAELEQLLMACANEEEVLEGLLESLSGIVQILKESISKQEKSEREILEPLLPAAESLSTQFGARSVFIVGETDAEGRLSPTYWLSIPSSEDTDQDSEQVITDLSEIAEKCCLEVDLKDYLEKMCLALDVDSDNKAKKKVRSTHVGKRKNIQAGGGQNNAEVTSKKPFISFAIPVAPMMRGRGFPRGMPLSSRANDPFRSRPPNTSRPPSMHVDDFVAMETHHPGSQPPIPKRSPKDPSRGRGRGFDATRIFPPGRGRYFPIPPSYSRREPDLNIYQGGTSRGAPIITGAGNSALSRASTPNVWSARISSPGKPPPPSSRGFGRGNNQTARKFVSLLTSLSRAPPTVDVIKPPPPPQSSHPDPRAPIRTTREPYGSPGGSNRFSRGARLGGVPIPMGSTHWPDSRAKSQDSRYRYYHR